MKIDQNTMAVLKNFAGICPVMVYYMGNDYIATKSQSDDVLVMAKIPEKFPNEIILGNLPEFLNITAMVPDPDFTFTDTAVVIRPNGEKRGGVKLKYTHKNAVQLMIVKNDINPSLSDDVVSMDVNKEMIAQIVKSANILNLKHIRFWGDSSGAFVDILNVDEREGEKAASFPLSDQGFPDFSVSYEASKFKMRNDLDYILDIDNEDGMARYTSKDNLYTYFMSAMGD